MGSVFLILTLVHVISVHRRARGATEARLSRVHNGAVEFLSRENAFEQGPKRNTGLGRFNTGLDGCLIENYAGFCDC